MVTAYVLAATLYVCPGNVYTDQAKPGCEPMRQQDEQGGFGNIESAPPAPESQPQRELKRPVPGPPPRAMTREAAPPERRTSPELSGREAQLCREYWEWIGLNKKVHGGGGATTEEVARYNELNSVFSLLRRPKC